MSLMPRNKKPAGLMDGCFGPSAYCEHCSYEKEPERIGKILCKSCDSMRQTLKEAEIPEDIMEVGFRALEGKQATPPVDKNS